MTPQKTEEPVKMEPLVAQEAGVLRAPCSPPPSTSDGATGCVAFQETAGALGDTGQEYSGISSTFILRLESTFNRRSTLASKSPRLPCRELMKPTLELESFVFYN